jgi:UDP-3-O-acyl-N-acetylglucosamine deacetylase
MILSPLPMNSGILFGDIATGETVPAAAAHVESTGYATTLRRGLVTARTVEHIMAALQRFQGNISRTAKALQIPRTTLRDRLRDLGIEYKP